MTTYVFDTGVFINLFRHYYRSQFTNLWDRFDSMINKGTITSTREVLLELERGNDAATTWAKNNKDLVFPTPIFNETQFVKTIFSNPDFQKLINNKQRLHNNPVADPFVISRARCLDQGCVVTTETYNEKGVAKIPNVCEHFKIDCTNFRGFMEKEGWTF